jgi:hypothetical protein
MQARLVARASSRARAHAACARHTGRTRYTRAWLDRLVEKIVELTDKCSVHTARTM